MKDNENKNENRSSDWSSASDWFTQKQSERINTSGGKYEHRREPVRQERHADYDEPYYPAPEREPVQTTQRRSEHRTQESPRREEIHSRSRQTAASERNRTDKKSRKENRDFAKYSRKNKNSGKSKDELRLEYAEKTRKRRKRRIIEWSVATIAAFAAIFVLLSLTVLFHIEEINVEGDSRYSAEEIIEASKVKTGDNLWRTSVSQVSGDVSTSLPYIGSVRLSRKIPATLTLVVEETKPEYAVKSGKKYILVNAFDKILETGVKKASKVIIIEGIKLTDVQEGAKLIAEAPENYETAKSVIACAKENDIKLTRINVSDQNNISAVCSLKIRLDIGSATQLSEKMKMANEVIEKLRSEGSLNEGTLNLKSTTKAYFKDGPIETVKATEPVTESTQPQTDENGNPVSTEPSSGESTSEAATESTQHSETVQTSEPVTEAATEDSIPEPPAERPVG